MNIPAAITKQQALTLTPDEETLVIHMVMKLNKILHDGYFTNQRIFSISIDLLLPDGANGEIPSDGSKVIDYIIKHYGNWNVKIASPRTSPDGRLFYNLSFS